MGIDVTAQTGIAREIINLMGCSKKQTLNKTEESVFTIMNDAANDLINSKSLNFSKIYNTLCEVGKAILEYFNNSFKKLASFCKKLADKILEFFSEKRSAKGSREDVADAAESYVGNVPDRATGNMLFSNGQDEVWCADTATTILKDIAGERLPDNFGASSVQGLMEWAKNEGCFVDTTRMSSSDLASYIANNVKPGDIMVEKRNGRSHVRIVTKVYDDGSFDVVEGNCSNKLCKNHITPDEKGWNSCAGLSGFIKMDRYIPFDYDIITEQVFDEIQTCINEIPSEDDIVVMVTKTDDTV